MVDKKDGNKKQDGGKNPPAAPISPVNPISSSAPSGEVRQGQDSQPQHNISEAAIVKLTAALVRWTGVLAVATIALGVVAYFQWRELHKTDETLQKTLFVSQRPWVSVQTSIAGPFSFHKDFASVPLKITMKNVGNSPAINVSSYPIMTNFKSRHMTYAEIPFDQCYSKDGSYGDFQTLFPGETAVETVGPMTGFDTDSAGQPIIVKSWKPIITVCTVYYSALDKTPLRTINIFQMNTINNTNPDLSVPFNFSVEPIPAEQLQLRSIGSRAE